MLNDQSQSGLPIDDKPPSQSPTQSPSSPSGSPLDSPTNDYFTNELPATDHFADMLLSIIPGSTVDKIMGMIYGHALGDAVGLTTSFKPKGYEGAKFPYTEKIKSYPVCDWSSNTDQLCLSIMSIICAGSGQFDPLDVSKRLDKYSREGFGELGDKVGTLAPCTTSIIRNVDFVLSPKEVAIAQWNASGCNLATNSCLMRVSIAAALPPPDLIEWGIGLSLTTHADPRCTAASVIHTNILHSIIYGIIDCPERIDELLYNSVKCGREFLSKKEDTELSIWIKSAYTGRLATLQLDKVERINYVFKCLGCNIYVLQIIKVAISGKTVPSFKKVINKFAMEGGDSSSNTALAGSVLGCYLGYSALPLDWIKALPNYLWLCELLVKLIKTITALWESYDASIGASGSKARAASSHVTASPATSDSATVYTNTIDLTDVD